MAASILFQNHFHGIGSFFYRRIYHFSVLFEESAQHMVCQIPTLGLGAYAYLYTVEILCAQRAIILLIPLCPPALPFYECESTFL